MEHFVHFIIWRLSICFLTLQSYTVTNCILKQHFRSPSKAIYTERLSNCLCACQVVALIILPYKYLPGGCILYYMYVVCLNTKKRCVLSQYQGLITTHNRLDICIEKEFPLQDKVSGLPTKKKEKRKAYLPTPLFLQPVAGNKHIFFGPYH